MFKFLYELLTDPLGLPIEWYYEYVILWIIDCIAYMKAHNNVGSLYDRVLISGSTLGSLCHWVIRVFHFFIMWVVTYGLIWIGKFVLLHKVEAGIIAFVVVLAVIVIKLMMLNSERKELSKAKIEKEQDGIR